MLLSPGAMPGAMAEGEVDMRGRVALVTGASSGIGLGTARGLAAMGAHVVMVCRDVRRCAHAAEAIRSEVPSASLEGVIADLSSQAEVRRLAEEVLAKHPRLHVLVNNAATVPHRRTLTPDGIEAQLAVNVLAPFMLTNLLLPPLLAAAPSRVVLLSSGTHRSARLRLDDPQFERGYRAMRVYSHSKLLDLMLARAFHRRLEGTGVSVNALTPGLISTGLAREFSGPTRALMNLFARPEAEGARVPLQVATSPALEGVSGRYVDRHGELDEPSAAARDDSAGERVWALCKELARMPEPAADAVRRRLD
jgi:NAD(P)-dependent dehydrogenase (short-subunit alcohol dehydrogenase family)